MVTAVTFTLGARFEYPCGVDIIEHFTIRGALGWDDTAAYCPSVQNDGAGATLSQAASEFRAIQHQIVAKNIKQRRRGTDVNGAHFSVHFEWEPHANAFSNLRQQQYGRPSSQAELKNLLKKS
jgi:hypothetical protein